MCYKVLIDMGMQDMPFESVITKFPESFTQDIVDLCKSRIEELEKIR